MSGLQGGVTTSDIVTLPIEKEFEYADGVSSTLSENTVSDAVLAARIAAAGAARDRQAEALLCRRLGPRARLYGLRHLRDPQAANDLAQDVLVMTLLRLREGSIRDPEQIASFVLGACRQMIVDRRRGERRREELTIRYAEDLSPAAIATVEAPGEDALQRCLEHLPERERSVLMMTYFDDSSAERIAQDLKVTAANVRVIRHRGLGHLRDCLQKSGELQ